MHKSEQQGAGPSDKTPAEKSVSNRRIDLDFVRGVAILLALGWHFNGRNTGYAVIDYLQQPGRQIGWAGVDLFFVISGFPSRSYPRNVSTLGFAGDQLNPTA